MPWLTLSSLGMLGKFVCVCVSGCLIIHGDSVLKLWTETMTVDRESLTMKVCEGEKRNHGVTEGEKCGKKKFRMRKERK